MKTLSESILININESAEQNETEEGLIKEVEREIEFCEEKLKDSSLKGQERTDTENDLNYAKKRLSDLQKSITSCFSGIIICFFTRVFFWGSKIF